MTAVVWTAYKFRISPGNNFPNSTATQLHSYPATQATQLRR